ncbi:MAG: ABC transporter permease [Blautia sp.]|nr:ABC transporter permease [Blautia sp.]
MFQRFKKDIRQYWAYTIYSAKAQLKSEVANSYLNWFWWVLEPFCFMLIHAFIFGEVFQAKEQYFPVFIFIGITMWDFFSRNVTQSVKLVKQNKPIVSKVYIPKYILLLSKLGVNGFKMLISFFIIAGMLVFWHVPVSLNVLYAIPILIDLFLICFGFGCFLLHFGVFIEDLSNVVHISLRLIFYMTGVFWNIMSRIPAPYNKYILRLNPTAFLLNEMRNCLLYCKTPHRKGIITYFIISLIISILGIRTIYKNENTYVKVI